MVVRSARVGIVLFDGQRRTMMQKPVEDVGASPMVAEMILPWN